MLRQLFAPGPLNTSDRNARNLYREVFWASILTAAAAFNAPFALRLGASNAEIGLLSSIPALLAILITVPSGQFYSRRSRRLPWIVGSLFIYRLGFLIVAMIAWLPVANRGTALIWLLIAFAIPAHFFGVGWSSMMADVVTEAKRSEVFAARNILVAIAVTLGTLGAGRWLERIRFPVNYQTLYFVGFLASMVSIWYIVRLEVPDSPVRPQTRADQGLRSLIASSRAALASEPDFLRLVVNTFAHGVGLWLVGPLYVLYYVRSLGAAEGWLGLNAMVGSLTPILGFYIWQRVIQRRGENPILISAISVVGLYPILVGLTPSLWLIPVWTALSGLVSPGVTLSHYPMLLKICPEGERPKYLGIYTMLMNVGAFIMPLLGVYLADRFGLRPVLIAGGIVCLVGSSSFRFHPLMTPDSLAVRQAEYAGKRGGPIVEEA